jgi:hypothetical protein
MVLMVKTDLGSRCGDGGASVMLDRVFLTWPILI